MSRENYEHAALVTDLGFCLEQLRLPGMPEVARGLLQERVAHHEVELGVANLAVASSAEVVPFLASAESELIPVAA